MLEALCLKFRRGRGITNNNIDKREMGLAVTGLLFLFIFLGTSPSVSAKGLWEYYQKGTRYKEQKEFYKAIEEFRKIIIEYPNSRKVIDAHFQIADCFRKNGDFKEAIKIYQQRLKENIENDEIASLSLFGMGLSYKEDGNIKESEQIYKKILREYPVSVCIPYLEDQIKTGKEEQEPGQPEALWHKAGYLYLSSLLGRLERLKKAEIDQRLEKTEQGYKNLIEKYPASELTTKARLQIGTCFGVAGDYRAAIEEYQAILSESTFTDILPTAQFWLGWCYFKMDNFEEAERSFKKVIENYPSGKETAAAYFGIGSVHKRRAEICGWGEPWIVSAEYEKAILCYQKILDEFPNSNWSFQAEKTIVLLKKKLTK